MSFWLVDASVFLAAEDRDDASFAAASRLFVGSEPLATLDLAFYDAAYVAAARESGGTLVSCDVRDLVSRGLACLPRDATRASWL
ncbi:MAG: hypothetical protein ACYCR4_12425 [Acidimicrobiales bacterium]